MKPGRFLIVVSVLVGLCLGLTSITGAQERQTYTVKPGDTLWDISQKFYHDQALWPKLWELNRYQTTNPHQISPGDVLTIYPLEELIKVKVPARPAAKKSLYDRGQPLNTVFPKYFNFLADPEGVDGTGPIRVRVKKIDPYTGKVTITYDEVRQVGTIIATMEHGPATGSKTVHGRLLLSFYDDVIVRFTKDVAKILDSASHNDPDPYFREFPIYDLDEEVMGLSENQDDGKAALGRLHRFKGVLTVVARVEKLAPLTEEQKQALAKSGGQDMEGEPVSYVAKITSSAQPIKIGDHVFLFKSIAQDGKNK